MNARITVASVSARVSAIDTRITAVEAGQARIEALLTTLVSAQVSLEAPAKDAPKAKAPRAPKAARKTVVLTRTALRAYKATPAGKGYAGVSLRDILDGDVAMPAGFHAPTGERAAAIAAWKVANGVA
jgi:hypothetical protein